MNAEQEESTVAEEEVEDLEASEAEADETKAGGIVHSGISSPASKLGS